MEIFLIWIIMAFIVEKITEYINHLFPFVGGLRCQWVNVNKLIALAVSVVLVAGARLDFFQPLEISFFIPWVGMALTAIFISGGSNAINDVLGFVRNIKVNTDPH